MLSAPHFTQNSRLIAHVDMDAFFTSVEQNDAPHLRGRPVVVGGSKGRGVVAAASYEARQYGLRSAMSLSVARRLCPSAVFLPSRMERYREISERIFSIFRHYTPSVEAVSIDEAYLDLSDRALESRAEIEAFGAMLKRRIASEIGLTASIGLAHNKLLAKIASDYDKPDGLVYLAPEAVERTLAPLPIRRLPGIGPRTAQKLRQAGILTIGQIHEASVVLLRQCVGENQDELRMRALGIDYRPVELERTRRSVSQESTFSPNLTTVDELLRQIDIQSKAVTKKLVSKRLWAKAVHLKLRSSGFSTLTRSASLTQNTQDANVICQFASELFQDWVRWQTTFSIRLIGVGVSVVDQAGSAN